MISNLKLEQSKEMLCLESAFATISRFYNRGYRFMFASMWTFPVLSLDNDTCKNIEPQIETEIFTKNLYSDFEKYHGLQIIVNDLNNPQEGLNLVHNELCKSRLSVVFLEAPYCAWYPENEKIPRKYIPFIITDINEKDSYINLLDIHLTKEIECLSMENFLAGCGNQCLTIVKKDINTQFDWKKLLKECLNKIESQNMFDNIRTFANHVEKYFSYNSEIADNANFLTSPLCIGLRDSYRSRLLFSLSIQEIAEKYEIQPLYEVQELLRVASSQWNVIKKLFLISFTKKDINYKLSQIVETINKLADAEEKIYNKLHEILDNNNSYMYNQKDKNEVTKNNLNTTSDIIFVDMSKVFNNKGFSHDCHDKADFTEIGQYFLPENLNYKEPLETKNMKFLFPTLHLSKNGDNVSCCGQEIEVEKDHYNKIMLLGCSEYGAYRAMLSVQFTDNKTENIYIEFGDWFPRMSFRHWAKYVAWEGNRSGMNNKKDKVYLYAMEYQIKSNDKIQKIILPDCPNIHLFAISLAK